MSEIQSQVGNASSETIDTNGDDAIFNVGVKAQLHERIAANDKIESETGRRDAQSEMAQRLVGSFKNLDLNGDGEVTQTEVEEFQNQKWSHLSAALVNNRRN